MTRTSVVTIFFLASSLAGAWVLLPAGGQAVSQEREQAEGRTVRKRDPDRRAEDRPDQPRRERVRDRSGDRQQLRDRNPAVETQRPTVKLEFTLTAEEERSFVVLCATEDYLLKHDIAEPNHDHALDIAGKIQWSDDPERVLVTFEAMTHHADHNEVFDATFRAAGSVHLKFGSKTTLATLGDQPLALTATVEP